MEPEGSLPCSQEPSTGPYPEPDQSTPYHHDLCYEISSIISWLVSSLFLSQNRNFFRSEKGFKDYAYMYTLDMIQL
jgi:hypothetical protein